MQVSFRRLAATALALALAACAKQQPLPVASVGDTNRLSVATGQQIILDGSKSDPKGQGALTYQWSLQKMPRGSRARIESPQSQVTRFTADVPTTVTEQYVVQLVVRSQYFVSEAQFLTITALECGVNVPAVNNLAATPSSGAVDVPVQLTATVDDKDNDAECQPQLGNRKQVLRYAWSLSDLPAGSKAKIRDTAAVQASFTPDVAGVYTAVLVVTDSTGLSSAPTRVDVQVQPCGAAFPVVNSTTSSPLSPNLLQATQLTAQVTDADNDVRCKLNQKITLHWEAISLPTGSHATLNNPSADDPSFTPDVPGEYDFRVIATDDTGRSSAASAPLRIITKTCGGNPPLPVVQLIPAQASIGQPVALQATASDEDEACGVHETFSYRWSLLSVPGGSAALIAAPTAFNASFVPDAAGDYAIGMTITDSSGTTASSVTHLAVAVCGQNPPSIDNLLGVTTGVATGNKVHVTAAVHDADSACFGPAYDSSQSYLWTLTGKPAGSGAALVDPVAKAADFTADVPGTYQVQLVVTDATGLASAPALFTTRTSSCGAAAPQVISVGASNLTPDPGVAIQLFAQTSDPDNGGACNLNQAVSLQWSIAARPAKSSAVVSDPAARQPNFTADVPGSYQFMVVAVDSTGLRSTPGWLTVTATACGTGIPSVAVRPAIASAAPLQAVALSAVPFDSDTSCGLGDTFSYAWRIVSSPAGSSPMLSDPAGASPLFTANLPGAYLLSAVVSDARGHVSAPAFANVTIAGCGALPPLTGALVSSAAALGTVVTLSATSATAQACGAATSLSYAWEITSRPVSSSAFLDSAIATTPHFTPDVAGAYQVRLLVRDSLGLESTASYANLTVAPCIASNLQWPAAAPFLSPSFVEPDGSAGTAAYLGTRVVMKTNESDPPGACGSAAVLPMQYQWALVSRPAGSAAVLDSSSAKTPSFVPDLPGDYQLAARVSDALGGLLPTRFATVTAGACGTNLPQVAIAAPASSALSTLQTLHLQVQGGTATDADGYPGAPAGITCPARFAVSGFQYAWTVSPGVGAAALPMAGLGTDFQANVPGVYTVQLVATASNGLKSAPATQVLTVGVCGSHAPYIASVSTKVLGVATARPLVNDTVVVTATANDDDIGTSCGDSISGFTWALAGAPPGSSVVGPTSQLASFSFQPEVAGRYLFTVSATDSRGLVSAPYTVAIDTALCAPALAAPSQSAGPISLGQLVTLTSALPSDACVPLPSFTYAWQIDAAPAGSVASLSASAGAAVSFRPDLRGAYTVQVVATDQAGFSSGPALAVVQVGATNCSLSPVLGDIGSSLVVPDAGDLTVLSAPLNDLNGSTCAAFTAPYHWRWSLLSRPAGSSASLAASDPSPSFVPDLPGSYQLGVQVTDALGNVSALVSGFLATSSCGANLPTAAIGGPEQAPTHTAALFTGTVGDADNSCPVRFHVPLASRWSVLTAPPGATALLSSTSGATTTLTADQAGSYVIGLVATAGNGLRSATATASITLSDCGATPPQILSVSASVSRPPVGSGVSLTANAVDPDNVPGGSCGPTPISPAQTLSYRWRVISAPAGASVDASAATGMTFGFVAGAAGTYLFEVTATDSAGFSSAPFRIAVPTGGCAPGLTGASVSTAAPAVGSSVTLSALPPSIPDTCVSGSAPLAYFWSVTSRPLRSSAAIASPTAASPSFTADVPGTYQFQVTVTDAAGFSASATTTLTAGGCGAGPSVALRPYDSYEPGGLKITPAVNRDDSIALSATVSGGGCSASAVQYRYSWSMISRPVGSSAALDQPSAAAPTFIADVPNGTWQVGLVVRDQLGNASTPVYGAITASDCGARRPVPGIVPGSVISAVVFSAVSLTASAADPEASCPARFAAAPLAYDWSVSARPLAGAAPAFSSSAASASLTPNFPGTYQVQVIATGTDGIASAPAFATIVTGPCGYNAPTVASITGAQVLPAVAASPFDARSEIVFTGNTDDLDNDAACLAAGTPHQAQSQRWRLTAAPPGSAAQMLDADTLAPRLFPDLPGSYTVAVVASDDKGLTGTRSSTFTVSACGSAAPAALDNQPLGTPAFSATQTLTASNVLTTTSLVPRQLALAFPIVLGAPNVLDTDTLAGCGFPATYRYAWQLSGPAGSQAPLGGAATATPSFVPDVTGVYTLSLKVTDTTGLSSTRTFAIDVECGAAGPLALDDAARGKAAFSATQSLAGLNVSGFATPQALAITHSTLATTPVAFYPGQPVQLAANVTDTDASCAFPEVISYAWEIASAPAGSIAALNNPAAPSPSFAPDLAGEYDFRLTLTDSTGRTSTRVFATGVSGAIVGVSSCGAQAPAAAIALDTPLSVPAPAAAQVLYSAATVVFDGGSSSTPDSTPLNEATGAGCGLSPTLTYQWSLTEQPFFSGTALTNAGNVTAALVSHTDGLYGVQLVVSDGRHASAPASVLLRSATPSRFVSTFTATPTSGITADGVQTSALSIVANDSAGRGIGGVPVGIAVSNVSAKFPGSQRDFVTQSALMTPAGGTVTGTLASTLAGNKTVVVSLDAIALPSIGFTYVAGPAALLEFSTEPPLTVPQNLGMSAVSVTVDDQFGNPIAAGTDGANTTSVTVSLDNFNGVGGTPQLGVQTCTAASNCSFAACTSARCSVTTSAGTAKFFVLSSPPKALAITKLGTFALFADGKFTPASSSTVFNYPKVTSHNVSIVPPPKPSVAPTGVSATASVVSGADQVVIAASGPDFNLSGYNVYRTDPLGNSPTLLASVTVAGPGSPLSYTDSAVVDNTAYFYKVSQVNPSGEGPLSSPAVTATTAPSAPTGVATTPGDGQVKLTWTASAGATGYAVYRATSNNFSSLPPATAVAASACDGLGNCSFIDTGAANQTSYYYEVGATNAGGEHDSAAAGPVIPVASPDASHSSFTVSNAPIADGTTANSAQLLVTLADASGNPIPNVPVSLGGWRAADTLTPGGGFTNPGFTDASGQFTAALKSTVAETKNLTALVGPFNGQISLALPVTFVGGPPTKLVFTLQPGDAAVNRAIPVEVAAEDVNGNPTGQAGNVSVVITPVTTATLSGTSPRPLLLGTANFNDLSINNTGAYTLTASMGALVKISSSFNVTASTVSSYTAIAAARHACSVRSDGSLYCWGPNDRGQLGDGSTAASAQPVRVGAATSWTQVSTGLNFTCGLQGTALFCWGDNTSGQLGQTGTDLLPHSSPLPVSAGTLWAAVTSGDAHACATDNTGSLFCWGDNSSGQLGLAATNQLDQTLAPSVSNGSQSECAASDNNSETFIAGATGPLTQVGLPVRQGTGCDGATVVAEILATSGGTPSGTLATSNPIAECSLPPNGSVALTTFTFPSPVTVTAGSKYAVNFHLTGPTLFCMGFLISTSGGYPSGNAFTSTTPGLWNLEAGWNIPFSDTVSSPPASATAPALVSAGPWASVSAGDHHTCGLKSGALYCWGQNGNGQAGQPSGTVIAAPTVVGSSTDWIAVDAGASFSCGLRSNAGSPLALCWGSNGFGQLGNAGASTSTPTTVAGLAAAPLSISAGQDHACARLANNSLACFGNNDDGQLGNGSFLASSTPVTVAGGKSWSQVSAGDKLTCALDSAGAASCWGNNSSGQAGAGVFGTKSAPTRVDSRTWTALAAGLHHTCALRSDGTLWCAGDNLSGQLGDGTTTPRSMWTQEVSQSRWLSLGAGSGAAVTCAVRSDGALFCWGDNSTGALGTGSASPTSSPTRVGLATNWTQVSTNGGHTCAVASEGNAFCWGANGAGQLGIGSTSPLSLPGASIGASNPASPWKQIATGADNSCALTQSGLLYCWGADGSGQSQAAGGLLPQVEPAAGWTSLSLGNLFGCGLQGAALSCWGNQNAVGDLGNGGNGATPTPVSIAGTYASVATGEQHACAVAQSGQLSCWGSNSAGQIGLGTIGGAQTTATLIGTDSNWKSLALGMQHSCGLRTDGSLWCWGGDGSGQLGDGGPTVASPAAVVDPGLTPSGTPDATQSTLSLNRTLLPADGVTRTIVTVVVKTAAGAAVANQPVVLSVDGTGNTLVASGSLTDGAGAVTATLTSTVAATKTITAAVGGFNLNATAVFQAGAPVAGATTLTVSPGSIPSDGVTPAAISVSTADAQGNPIPRQLVQLSTNGGAVFASYGYTDAAGSYATTLTSTTPDTETITATLGAVTKTQSLTVVGPPAAVTITVQPQPATTGTSIGTVQVTLADAGGAAVLGSFPVSAALTTANGANLVGTTAVSSSGPNASFTGLVVDKAGIYTLTITSGAASGVSSSFTIANPWSPAQIYGGTINALLFDPNNADKLIAFAATNIGLFRSTDGGTTWTQVRIAGNARSIVYALAMTPGSAAFAATDSGLYRSTDKGLTWAATPLTASTTSVVVGISNVLRVYALTGGHVFRSDDGSANFNDISSGLGTTPLSGTLAVDNTSSPIAYFATSTKVFQVTSIGGSWADLGYPTGAGTTIRSVMTPNPANSRVLYLGSDANGVYSWDQGANTPSWQHPNNTGLTGSVRALAMDGSANLYAGLETGGSFSFGFSGSNPIGQTWTANNASLNTSRRVQALGTDPNTAQKVLIGQLESGISRTTNAAGAATSAFVNAGVTAANLNAVASSGTTSYAFVAGIGMLSTTSPAGAWADMHSSSLFATGATTVSGIFPDASGTVFVATDGGPLELLSAGTSWVAYGASWPASAKALSVVFDGSALWAGTHANGILKATGAAGVWTAINAGLTGSPQDVTALAVDGVGNLYATPQDAMYFLRSGTNLWTLVQITGGSTAGGTALVANPTGGIYASFNGSGVWSAVPSGPKANGTQLTTTGIGATAAVIGLALDSAGNPTLSPAGTLYATVQTGTPGVWRLTPAATTWVQASNGLIDTTTLQSIAVTSAANVLVASPVAGAAVTHTGGL